MKAKILGLIFLGLLTVSVAANAVPITWELQGVTFEDGGTAIGSFIYDATTNTYSAIDIQTTGNLAFTYTTAGLQGFLPFGFDIQTGTSDGSGFLQLIMLSALTDAGGTIALGQVGDLGVWETTYDGGIRNGNSPPFRAIIDGDVSSVSSVPEPATLSLLGIALFGIGFMRRLKVN